MARSNSSSQGAAIKDFAAAMINHHSQITSIGNIHHLLLTTNISNQIGCAISISIETKKIEPSQPT